MRWGIIDFVDTSVHAIYQAESATKSGRLLIIANDAASDVKGVGNIGHR